MTREQFIEKYRFEIGGMLADASTHDRRSGHLAMWMRAQFENIDRVLGQAFDELKGPLPTKVEPKLNGTHPALAKGTK